MSNSTNHFRIGFIGAGILGSGLALALYQTGYQVSSVASRRFQSAQALADKIPGCVPLESAQAVAESADLVFITTPDAAIKSVVAAVTWRPGQWVAHCCGAHGREILAAATARGAVAGAFHPCQTFAGLTCPEPAAARLAGVTFALAAASPLSEVLEEMAGALGGRVIRIDGEQRTMYHAAAVLGCGFLVTLLQTAVELLQDAGLTEEDALAALGPLSRATLENVMRLGTGASVTGPMARGDAATVGRHLEVLGRRQPEAAALYHALALKSLTLVSEPGPAPESAGQLGRILADFQPTHPIERSL